MMGGHVIICDDIRDEVGNKVSFMGVFAGALLITTPFPATLPKLGFVILWEQALDEELLPIEIVGYFPWDPEDKPSLSGMMDPKLIPDTPAMDGAKPAERLLHMELRGILGPVILKHSGVMRIYAIRDGRKIVLRRLEIRSTVEEQGSLAPANTV